MRIVGFHPDDDRDPGMLMRWFLAAVVVASVHIGAVLALGWNKDAPRAEEPPAVMLIELMPMMAAPDHAVENAPLGPIAEETSPSEKQTTAPPPDKTDGLLPLEPQSSKPAKTKVHSASEQKSAPAPLRTKKNASSAAPVAGGAIIPSAVPPTWRSALLLHLNKHKRYPATARQNGETGVAQLQFTMDRSGRVLSHHLLGSAGSAALDQEALAMIKRATPLPAIPREISGNTLTLTVPVRFSLHQ